MNKAQKFDIMMARGLNRAEGKGHAMGHPQMHPVRSWIAHWECSKCEAQMRVDADRWSSGDGLTGSALVKGCQERRP